MPTPRETILQALLAALQTMFDPAVLHGAILPERIPSSGPLILRDGDLGTPEVRLSPLQYHFEYRAEVEVIMQGKTPAAIDADFDTLLEALAGSFPPNEPHQTTSEVVQLAWPSESHPVQASTEIDHRS